MTENQAQIFAYPYCLLYSISTGFVLKIVDLIGLVFLHTLVAFCESICFDHTVVFLFFVFSRG